MSRVLFDRTNGGRKKQGQEVRIRTEQAGVLGLALLRRHQLRSAASHVIQAAPACTCSRTTIAATFFVHPLAAAQHQAEPQAHGETRYEKKYCYSWQVACACCHRVRDDGHWRSTTRLHCTPSVRRFIPLGTAKRASLCCRDHWMDGARLLIAVSSRRRRHQSPCRQSMTHTPRRL